MVFVVNDLDIIDRKGKKRDAEAAPTFLGNISVEILNHGVHGQQPQKFFLCPSKVEKTGHLGRLIFFWVTSAFKYG